jgi:3-methyladenine DNA glycosylase AlkD
MPTPQQALKALANPAKAIILQRFFKTGPGQYGEGDVFIGVTVPQIRSLVKQFRSDSFEAIEKLMASKIHEERALGVFMLVDAAKQAAKAKDAKKAKACHDFYLSHLEGINNWDLVDLSAQHVVGAWLFDKDRSVLTKLARSKNMWHRRVAVLSSFYFIYQGDYADTLKLCEMLLEDPQDLSHKATGWMLREVGKRGGLKELKSFLEKHGKRMPRTMLRYAIERFAEGERKAWLEKTR